MWDGIAARLEGRIVVVEPLREEHGPGLRTAAQDMDWSFMPVDPLADDDLFDRWLEDALGRGESGEHVPFAVLAADTEQPLGSTRYLSLRPEHRGLEIGWTWLTRSAWTTGANVEAKLLLLTHAFERLCCMRVEFKTDALNERSRRALAALPAQFEGVFRKHMLVGNDGTRLRDSAWYAIVDDDWPTVKASLESRLRARARSHAGGRS
jgi:RimJ/RimL family protein N-acetyltransferase